MNTKPILFSLLISLLSTNFVIPMEKLAEDISKISLHDEKMPKPRFTSPIKKMPFYLLAAECNRHINIDQIEKETKNYCNILNYMEFWIHEKINLKINLSRFLMLCTLIIRPEIVQDQQRNQNYTAEELLGSLREKLSPRKAYILKEPLPTQLILVQKNPGFLPYYQNSEDLNKAISSQSSTLAPSIEEKIMNYYENDIFNPGEFNKFGVGKSEIAQFLNEEEISFFHTSMCYTIPEEQNIGKEFTRILQSLHNMLKNKIHPIKCAAYIHHQIVTLHPFIQGNGKIARFMMNLILIKNCYSPLAVTNTYQYREALRAGVHAFEKFIIKQLKESEYRCHWCSKERTKKALRCSQCKATQYCSKECQKAAWNSGHKDICKKEN